MPYADPRSHVVNMYRPQDTPAILCYYFILFSYLTVFATDKCKGKDRQYSVYSMVSSMLTVVQLL